MKTGTEYMSELQQRIVTSIIAGGMFLCAYFLMPRVFTALLVATLGVMLVAELPKLFALRSWQFWVVAPLYPTVPMFCLIYLHYSFYAQNLLIPLYPFLATWITDMCAYFVGKSYGRHKICPKISPGKSWEGLCGGFVGVLAFNSFLFSFSVWQVAWSLCIAVLALAGDLCVSWRKRRVGLKDVGALLPGHGGLLDRFDGLLFVAPAVTIAVFGNFLVF